MTILKKSLTAIAVATTLGLSMPAMAAGSSSGSIVGSITGAAQNGLSVTVKNNATGFERQIELDDSGNFRFPQLAIGTYEIILSKDDRELDRQAIRVTVGATTTATFELNHSTDLERIAVTGARISAVDLSASDSGLTIGEVEIDRLPMGRDVTSIAMLAPGTVKGDSRFGNVASFSGSSVAENVCYINGMNVTDPEKGLGCGSVPFEFYKEFQIKTGGYSAQYGRSTGGVINAVTKSGTNEFEFGATAYYTPDYLGDGVVNKNNAGTVYRDSTSNKFNELNASISVGGPIIKDNLFFYAMYNPRKRQRDYAFPSSAGSRTRADSYFHEDEVNDSFWGLKLDWEINDRNRLSYFGFSDSSTTERTRTAYDVNEHKKDPSATSTYLDLESGGDTHTLTFTSDITDEFSMSVMAGRFKTDGSIIPSGTECSTVVDNRVNPTAVGCGSNARPDNNTITRDAFRVDFEWALDDHLIRFGYDQEDIKADHTVSDPGDGFSYTYDTVGPGGLIQGTSYVNNTGAPQDYVRKRQFVGGGKFKTENYAYYLEDQWSVTDQLNLTIGVRSDVATNYGKTGVAFVKLDDQIAPRIGLTYDPDGEGTSKIFANYGVYYFPIPINTNYRTASGIVDTSDFLTFTGINADGTPTGTTVLDTRVNGTGSIPDPELSAAPEYSAQSLEEYIIGYQREFNDEYSGTVRATYRTTVDMGDDFCGYIIDPTGGGNICTLFNPGKGHTFGQDLDGDGHIDPGSQRFYSAEELGMPEGKRDYTSVQFELVHRSDDFTWTAQYVWSHSYGNNEGGVNSDNLQTDTGVSSFLDFKASAIGADGNLPNDRRHAFKFYGSYAITEDISFGWNSSLIDGRPLSIRGQSFPLDHELPQPGYGDTYYVLNPTTGEYIFNPRGSNGRSPWVFNLDASLSYAFTAGDFNGKLLLDVFNVLDTRQTLAVNELAETSSGNPNQFYGMPMTLQTPRQVRFGINVDF